MSAEDDSLVVNDESDPFIRGSRVDAGYPGNGFVPSGDERIRDKDGRVKTASGNEYSIFMKANTEFFVGCFFWFFGTMAYVFSTHVAMELKNTAVTAIGAYAVDNSTGLVTNITEYSAIHGSYAFLNQATGLVTRTSDQTVIANPLATFLSALSWGGLLYLCLRMAPGVSLNPWITIAHNFFAWKKGGMLSTTHYAHIFQETVWCVVAQFASGLAAIVGVYFCMDRDTSMLGETLPGPGLDHEWKVLIYEAVASFLFMTLINIYSRPRRDVSAGEQAVFLGASLFFITMAFSGFTGASVNFVHTLSPALVRSIMSGVPLRTSVVYYLIGQAIGYASASFLAWFMNTASHMRLFRTITSSSKDD